MQHQLSAIIQACVLIIENDPFDEHPFCGFHVETTSHPIVTCEIVSRVWDKLFKWLGCHVVIHQNLRYFESLLSLGGRVKYKDGNLMV